VVGCGNSDGTVDAATTGPATGGASASENSGRDGEAGTLEMTLLIAASPRSPEALGGGVMGRVS
jgi:hypothetical protein